MRGKVKPLNHKRLRRVVSCILDSEGKLIESDHAEKHPSLNLTDVLLALVEEWRGLKHKWDKRRNSWKYEINTTGTNDRRLTLIFIPNEKKNEIRVVTRYQDEYAGQYRSKNEKSRVSVSKKESHS
jgi:hypothetical protein